MLAQRFMFPIVARHTCRGCGEPFDVRSIDVALCQLEQDAAYPSEAPCSESEALNLIEFGFCCWSSDGNSAPPFAFAGVATNRGGAL